MDVGEGLLSTYRVLKINGTEALVLAMQDNNIGTSYQYNSDYVTTSFNDTNGIKYADEEICLNL